MKFQEVLHSRTGAVIIGAAVLVGLGGASGAVAATMVTSSNIKDDTIRSRDVHNGTLGERDMNSYTVGKINQQAPTPKYPGADWSIIDRNTIGNGDAFLRSGPSSTAFGEPADQAKPPMGVGSLGIRTGSTQDKADFGDAVDFAGNKVADLTTLKYSIYTTGENNSINAANLPNLTYEIDPNNPNITGPNGEVHYTSMVYVPAAQAAGWKEHDASAATNDTGAGWYFTNGPTATATGCTPASLCTLADAQKGIPDATIYTLAISKGRDNAFSGAVDKLVVNNATYDFEPNGVIKSTS
jgi:hypothetical protein